MLMEYKLTFCVKHEIEKILVSHFPSFIYALHFIFPRV